MDLNIIKIASDTSNNKVIKHYTDIAKQKNPLCGDHIEIKLNIYENQIIDFAYQTKSCVFCQASASMLSKKTIKKDIISTKKFLMIAEKLFENDKISLNSDWKTLKKIFNKKNLSRKECLLLPIRALLKIIKQRNV
ncbi:MAG: iron-sulfur cluster assembly scaffold protein [Pelagibacteraceae bacterium]|mgnify:FL=1|jgi:nitrogen fixation NifU-like protein|nr:iron-sulfur cluster assembly scaffold protein [Pelagibacteraceae bacterium]|tara:strand:- start:1057 stop:1464 length:408 start_codon:yes stop_codon:yes gene_type:complete